ncbi:hypothetical protein NKJ90_18910 [Mesorhizobium sp. M0051]|uniref:hypothetical protein n=1 Tax=unclassified Mesorhizobium TaxID=325217 RepID=UPI0003CDD168|nr:hypothetical protein [Mesorhizobium sp. LNHC252B00]ESY75457.1 hypothetical protein X743_03670 [Mesorhizobium sp. LNHC252B00]
MKNPDFTDAGDPWLDTLIASPWQSRADWATEGHWLSINLPTALPAEQPRIGRDKIAC